MRKALVLAVSTFVLAGFSAVAQEGAGTPPPAAPAAPAKEMPAKKEAAKDAKGAKKKHHK